MEAMHRLLGRLLMSYNCVASAVGGSPCLAVLTGGGWGVCWPALPFRGTVAVVLKDWH